MTSPTTHPSTAPTTPTPPDAGGGKPTWKDRVAKHPWAWATGFAFVFTTLIAVGLRPFMRHIPDPPERVLQLPDFRLTNEANEPFGSQNLRGTVWVADFFFTSCPSICAQLTRNMHKMQDAFERERVPVKLVSISVDSANDTPSVLAAYARKHEADPARWRFLTGPPDDIRTLIVDGFKTHVGNPELTGAGVVDIAHASYFVLVDQDGWIRGYYEATKEEELSRLFHEARNVVRHPHAAPLEVPK